MLKRIFLNFPRVLIKKHTFAFNAPKQHPTIQKILGVTKQTVNQVLPQIVGLGDKNSELALKLLLQKVYSSNLPQTIIKQSILQKQLKKHPQLFVDATIFAMKQKMKTLGNLMQQPQKRDQIDKYVREISQDFMECFSFVKKIPIQSLIKHQIILHKRFADFNLHYVSKLTTGQHKVEFLKKSCQFYQSMIKGIAKLITTQRKRLQKLIEEPAKEGKEEDEKVMITNSVMESIRTLIETNSQATYSLFTAQNQIKSVQNKQDKKVFWFHPSLFHMLSDFERAISYYNIFQKISAYSIFYHKLKKTQNQLNYHFKLNQIVKSTDSPVKQKADKQKIWKQLMQAHQKLYIRAKDDLTLIMNQPQHLGIVFEVTQLMFTLRLAKIIRQPMQLDQFKNKLALQAGAIINILTNRNDKKTVSALLAKSMKQLLQVRMAQQYRKKP